MVSILIDGLLIKGVKIIPTSPRDVADTPCTVSHMSAILLENFSSVIGHLVKLDNVTHIAGSEWSKGRMHLVPEWSLVKYSVDDLLEIKGAWKEADLSVGILAITQSYDAVHLEGCTDIRL